MVALVNNTSRLIEPTSSTASSTASSKMVELSRSRNLNLESAPTISNSQERVAIGASLLSEKLKNICRAYPEIESGITSHILSQVQGLMSPSGLGTLSTIPSRNQLLFKLPDELHAAALAGFATIDRQPSIAELLHVLNAPGASQIAKDLSAYFLLKSEAGGPNERERKPLHTGITGCTRETALRDKFATSLRGITG